MARDGSCLTASGSWFHNFGAVWLKDLLLLVFSLKLVFCRRFLLDERYALGGSCGVGGLEIYRGANLFKAL